MKKNGTARLIAFDAYIDWYSQLSLEEADALYERYSSQTEELKKQNRNDPAYRCLLKMFTVTEGSISWSPSEHREKKRWPGCRQEMANRLRRFREFAEDFEQPVRVDRWEEGMYAYLYLGNPEAGILVIEPEKYLEYIPTADYSNMTPGAVRGALGAPRMPQEASLIPAGAEMSMTQNGVSEQLRGQEKALEDLNRQMEDVKGAKTGELAALRAEIEAKQAELEDRKRVLMAELKEKKAAMEEMKEKLENQIYLLDSQIYCIRCYAGEVVRFGKLRSGRNAPDTVPIVIHQKLRFLDEELGLLASLYEIQWENVEMFEDFLKHSALALDTFAPNERCVTLVRLSRSAKQLGRDATNPYANMLQEYEYYHGRTVGIIIRNGENLYLGWTDEERVHIDDDLIVGRVVTEVSPADGKEPDFLFESDRVRHIKEQKEKRRKIMDAIISRSFIYNILQGIVDNTPMLPLPAGVQLNRQSEYVIYSMADRWLTDDRYGSFTDIIQRCNAKVTRGDMLLTVQKLVPEHERIWGGVYYGHDRTWDNARGRGEANRTHDCSVDDCTIYPANLVEYDKPVSMTRYRKLVTPDFWARQKNPDAKPHWVEGTMKTDEYEDYIKKWPEDRMEAIETYIYRKPHVFVSVKKKDGWYGYQSDARANFELYREEYINLTYLNSTWLEWVITNRKLGGWTVGGKMVDYAYAIRYLKVAMDFIRKREKLEKAALDTVDPAVCQMPEWPVLLSEWKLEAGVREINEYQAKRFVKALRKGKE